MVIRIVKAITFSFHSQKYRPHAIYETTQHFYKLSQGSMSLYQYQNHFRAHVEVLEHIAGIAIVPDDSHIPNEQRNDSTEENGIDRISKEQYLALAFLQGADIENRYCGLLEKLESNGYPPTVREASILFMNWEESRFNARGSARAATTRNPNRRSKDHIVCFNCNKKGHYANQCPGTNSIIQGPNENGIGMSVIGVQSETLDCLGHPRQDTGSGNRNCTINGRIPNTWVLLSTQSPIDVFVTRIF